MKKMRKLLSIVMATALALTMALPASAQPVAGTQDTYTITINDKTDEHVYNAYQIFKVNPDDLSTEGNDLILSNIMWGNGINAETLIAALQADTSELKTDFADITYDAANADASAAAVAKVLSEFTTDEAIKFAKIAGEHLAAVGGTSGAWDEANQEYTIENLAPGYYLVKDANPGDLAPNDPTTAFMLQIVGDAEVDRKANPVDKPEKEVKDDETGDWTVVSDHDIGDIVDFKLTAHIPDDDTYKQYDEYRLVFHDTLSDNLSLYGENGEPYDDFDDFASKIVVKVGDTVLTDGFTVVEDYAGDGDKSPACSECSFHVVFADTKANPPQIAAGSTVTVEYKALLTGGYVINDPETNTLKVEYSNDPNTGATGESNDEKVQVFSFELDINKIDGAEVVEGATPEALKGAQFVLWREDANGTPHYVQIDLDNEGKVSGWLDTKPTKLEDDAIPTTGKTGVLVSNDNGKIVVKGLDEGTYYLEEIKAPAGYNDLEYVKKIVIDAEYTEASGEETTIKSVTITITDVEGGNGAWTEVTDSTVNEPADSNKTDSTVGMTVKNNKGVKLPETGGMGTTIFTVGGASLMLLAVVLLVTKKKMSNR